jgi:hypothetical protein
VIAFIDALHMEVQPVFVEGPSRQACHRYRVIRELREALILQLHFPARCAIFLLRMIAKVSIS